jgi:hypothetical protein
MGAICSRRANRKSEESEIDEGRKRRQKKPWPPSSPEDNNANGVLLVNKTSAVPVLQQSNNNKGEAMEKSRHEPADFHGSKTTVAHPHNNDFSFELAVISRHREDGNKKEEKKQPPSRKLSNKASAVRSMTTTAAKKSASKVRLIPVYNSSHNSLNLISEEKMKTMMPSVDNKPTFSFGFIVAAVSGWCL